MSEVPLYMVAMWVSILMCETYRALGWVRERERGEREARERGERERRERKQVTTYSGLYSWVRSSRGGGYMTAFRGGFAGQEFQIGTEKHFKLELYLGDCGS